MSGHMNTAPPSTVLIIEPSVWFADNDLTGPTIIVARKKVVDLKGVFRDDDARANTPADALAYSVLAHLPVPEGTEAGLFFGISILEPGLVGDEYYMTRGHFHSKPDRCEYYWGLSGTGLLLLMDRDRNPRVESVKPGSLHFIPGHTAHRLVNTGNTQLRVGACWPSDAGHDYDALMPDGFGVRVFCRDGKPVIERSA